MVAKSDSEVSSLLISDRVLLNFLHQARCSFQLLLALINATKLFSPMWFYHASTEVSLRYTLGTKVVEFTELWRILDSLAT